MTPLLANPILQAAATLALGAGGGAVFAVAGLPAPWLSGAMVAVGMATLSRVPTRIPARLLDAVFVFLGISMGAGVTPDTLDRIMTWPLSIAALAVVITAIILLVTLYLHRVAGWDRATAFFASVPGALSYVMALALSTGRADTRRIAVSQSLRLFILVAILPAIIIWSRDAPLAPPLPQATGGGAGELALLIVAGTTTGLACRWMRVPAGLLAGGLLASAVLHVTGLAAAQLPNAILIPGFVVLGAMVGTRFAGAGWSDLHAILRTSLVAFLIGMGVSLAGAVGVAYAFDLPFGQTLLAFAPGGLEAMTILAFALNLDPAYVAAHQIARFVAMAVSLPFLLRLIAGRPEGRGEGE